MVPWRVGTYGLAAVVLVVAAIMLFAAPAWVQGSQQRQPVSEAQKDRIESLSDEQAEEQFVQAARASDAAGDLADETATARDHSDDDTNIDFITIDAENCTVDEDVTIIFQENQQNGGDVGVVVNGDGARIVSTGDEIEIRGIPRGSNIEFFTQNGKELTGRQLDVLSSSGIDCDDSDNNDGFDDDLLLLLLLELLEDNVNGDGGDGGNGDGGNGDGGNGDGDNGDDGDLDGDGDVDQEDELLEAENELNGEDTDGEDTLGDDFDDGEDGPVSATAEDGQAEASTPGAVASAGGDPDELEPLTSTPDDVVDEVPTSGPLPNTGGMPNFYWLVPLAGLLMWAGLPVYRWAKRRE